MASSKSSLPDLGSPHYFASLYAYVSEASGGPVDKHVFICILFCLMGRVQLPSANHLLLRTQREELSHLREIVVSMLSNVFGLTTLHIRGRSDTTPESLLSDLLSYSASETDTTGNATLQGRKGGSGISRAASSSGRRTGSSVSRSATPNIRSHNASLTSRGPNSVGPLPQALVVSSLGRCSPDTQECLWNIVRARSCMYNGILHRLPEDLLVVLLNDIGDGRERPHIIPCLLDQFSFSSYVNVASSTSQSPPQPSPSPSTAPIPLTYLHRLKHQTLPAINPFLNNYISNLVTATTQHPLLHSLLVGNRARAAFRHFTAVSVLLFSNEDGRTQLQHPTQEDVARVYVHVIGHRVSIRNVGEGVLSILDRTLAPLPLNESKEWKPGMRRGETVPQIMKDILVVV